MNDQYVTDDTLDWWVQQGHAIGPTVHSMITELSERRTAEQFTTYRLASGGDFADAGWWNTPDLFEETEWEERTEVIHETWGLITRESIWYGTDSNDDEDEEEETA